MMRIGIATLTLWILRKGFDLRGSGSGELRRAGCLGQDRMDIATGPGPLLRNTIFRTDCDPAR